MQTTLLGLAIAVILALVAALVAPLVVDWNHYRGAIESEASRLTGLAVRVNGSIDARLLPSPSITLRNVAVGEAGQAPQLRAGTLKLELALGPLLRGKVQASEVRLIAPQLDLALDRSGALALPKLSPAFRPQALSISRFAIEDGRVVLRDAASGVRLALQKLYFNGDVRSFAGPFSGEGGVVVGDALYGYRILGNAAAGGGIKVRLNVDPADRPLTSVFDGTLSFDHGVPLFVGAMSLARPVGATLANGRRVVSEPWRATAMLRINPNAASLKDLAIQYGPDERAVALGGSAAATFGPQPQLKADVAAMQVNLDRALADPDLTDRPPLVALRNVLQAFAGDAKLPLPARIGVSIGALTIGGATIESLSGAIDFDQTGWGLQGVQFHAPGMTEVRLSGRLSGTPRNFAFKGPAALTSADAGMLLAWLDGRDAGRDAAAGEAKALTASGEVTIASDRVAIDNLSAALDREKIEGRFAYNWPAEKRPARLDADLRAAELDVDAIRTFVTSALGGESLALPEEATLALAIGRASFAGVEAKSILTQVKFDAGKLQIDRLSVGDLGGARLDIGGRIDELSSRPRGRVTLDLDAGALDGLSDIAAKFAPQAAAALHRLAGRLAPAKVHAVLDVEHAAGASSTAALAVSGDLAAMRLAITGKANGEPSHLGAAALQIDGKLDADDGSALLALLGLDRLIAVDQLPGQLTLSAAGPLNGDIRIDGKVGASGVAAAVHGSVHLNGERSPSARLQIRAAAGDLRPLHRIMTGQAGVAVPVSAQAALAVDGSKLSFTQLAATVGKASVHGQVAVDLVGPIAVDGRIDADTVDAPRIFAMLLGLPRSGQGGAEWSGNAIGAGAFGAVRGAVAFKFGRAVFTPALIARDLGGVVHFRPSAISFDDVSGSIAGGRLTATLAFGRNAGALAAHAKIAIADAAAATLLGSAMNVAGGQLGLTLEADGLGATPAGVIGSLHGNGTATVKDAQFAGLDPAAFTAALQAAGRTAPIDIAKVQAAVAAALANGRVTVPAGNAAVTIAAGAINLNHVVLKTERGAELALDGGVDLGAAAIDARLTLSQAPPATALIATRPELSVAFKGPLAAPTRALDMSALVSWLTLRATELQTRRIEAIEANREQGAVAQAPHPEAPDLRLPPAGGVVESAVPANASGVPAGAPALERLQPLAAPPLVPDDDHSGSGNPVQAPTSIKPNDSRAAPHPAKSTATAGSPAPSPHRAAPPPSLPSLLNIFRTD